MNFEGRRKARLKSSEALRRVHGLMRDRKAVDDVRDSNPTEAVLIALGLGLLLGLLLRK